MQTYILPAAEVLSGYDAVTSLYARVPPLSHWRAWEYAAYQKYSLTGRILDLGCGDGRYFKLLWPEASEVIGVDLDPRMAELGRKSGIYNVVHTAPAHQVPERSESLDCVFANCSLEHMDHLDAVLAEVYRCLKPGGTLLCSVVTNRFIDWAVLPNVVAMAGYQEAASKLQKDFFQYHHLANPLSVQAWSDSFYKAKLIPEEHIPILPIHNSGFWLLMDSLWHLKRAGGGEMGDSIFPFLSLNPNFPNAFRGVLAGLLQMESNWQDCSGAVFLVKKAG